jgi:hypothetical protein
MDKVRKPNNSVYFESFMKTRRSPVKYSAIRSVVLHGLQKHSDIFSRVFKRKWRRRDSEMCKMIRGGKGTATPVHKQLMEWNGMEV